MQNTNASNETIAAIATAPGVGAIAIVRLSGPRAFEIANSIFAIDKNVLSQTIDLKSHHVQHGYIVDRDLQTIVDEVVLIPYKSPRSYTGEDLVEVTCHGGPVVTSAILALMLKNGARLARAGEFTERAFLSGKLDLTQAEAVLDLIQAKTTRQSRMALSALAGHLGGNIQKIRLDLLNLMSAVVAGIDFPEEVGEADVNEVAKVSAQSRKALEELTKTARSGRFMRDGLRLAIVGRPNAGKSSLMNQLLKFERAIVTEIAGTTRDSLEELLDLNGIPVVLIDTAGIRHTDDTVEKIGIERSRKAVAESDLVLFVVDLTAGFDETERDILNVIGTRPFVLIGNKVDVAKNNGHFAESKSSNCVGALNISAATGEGVDTVAGQVESWVFGESSLRNGQASLNQRQAELCRRAAEALAHVETTLASGLPQDCLATDLKTAVDALSEVCGESVSEEVIHQVFANFCIGK
ncbi:MAG: tRNA uridine-5-carboxymethylaminomethyl(34) synthesis GTPase MnmE [Candidatus Obscuribacterales bacterium]|nr:tRNA uridine-5-carboxymethylaminomethyl(34) synthesis GTPase MnmE [Candidatus Obscuribacterales bacterium]